MSAGAPPQTPLGKLTAPPDTLTGFKGAASRQGWEGMGKGRRDGCGWRGREGGEKGERGQREWEGRERTWDGTGREGKRKEKGMEREERGYSPKLQFLVPPLTVADRNLEIFASDLSVSTRRSLSSACYMGVARGGQGGQSHPNPSKKKL